MGKFSWKAASTDNPPDRKAPSPLISTTFCLGFFAFAEIENREYGKLVGKEINHLKIELANPTEDYISESGNKVFIYKTKKYGIPCERKFEINQNNIIESFTSSGCI